MMTNIVAGLIGFFVAIGLTLVFMPKLLPTLNRMYVEKTKDEKTSGLSPQLLGWLLLVPLVAGLLYLKLGSPHATSASTSSASSDSAPVSNATATMPPGQHEMGDFDAMAARLAAKLAKDPNNGEGWALLARSYVELQKYQDAISAFEKAMSLLPNDMQLKADYEKARTLAQANSIDNLK